MMHLIKASQIYSIGQGIIGSAAEENSRKRVTWEEGSSHLLPCSKNIACGWVHKLLADDDEANIKCDSEGDSSISRPLTDASDVVIYALKVTPETLDSMENNIPKDTSCWVNKSYELFHKCLAKLQPQNGGAQKDGGNIIIGGGVPLSADESLTMNLIIELAQ